MTAVDTNVPLDIVDGSPRKAAAAIALVRRAFPPLVVSAYAERRRATTREKPRRVVTDVLIGAHAETLRTPVTRDGAFFLRRFLKRRIVAPQAA